jgi:uncharacterized protein (TIGR00251 family)
MKAEGGGRGTVPIFVSTKMGLSPLDRRSVLNLKSQIPVSMLHLESHPDGAILPVRAQPGARRNELRGVQGGMLKVCVTQSPEKGKANKAVAELLSKKLRLKKSQIELIAGETSHQKRFLVRGITVDELGRRIQQAAEAV